MSSTSLCRPRRPAQTLPDAVTHSARACACLRLLRHDQRQAGGEAVDEGLARYGSDLAVAEEAGERYCAKVVGHGLRVVVRVAEQADAAAVAGEQQPAHGRAA